MHMSRRRFLATASSCLVTSRVRAFPGNGTIEVDAGGQAGLVIVRGPAHLGSSDRLVLAPDRDYSGRKLRVPRPVRLVFEAETGAALTVDNGASLVIQGKDAQPVEVQTLPADPPAKPVIDLLSGSENSLRHASFINVGIRVAGRQHAMSDVSVQYSCEQPAFTFAGARGRFERLLAHHATWGFSFEPLNGSPCDVTITRSMIRSCGKDGKGARHQSGGSVRAIAAERSHRLRFQDVDWDATWDSLDGADLRTAGGRPRIVALGDSIVQGSPRYLNFWDYIPGNDDSDNSWPYVFQKRAPQFFVINRGEGGFVTSEMLERLPGIIEKIRPQYCFLGGGTNNLSKWTPQETFADFNKMHGMLQAANIIVVQLAITPNTRYAEREDRIIETNGLLRAACQQRGIRFEDTYTLLLDESGRGLNKAYDAGDGLHLNKTGYQKVAYFLQLPEVRKA